MYESLLMKTCKEQCGAKQYPTIVVFGSVGSFPGDNTIDAVVAVFCMKCNRSKFSLVNKLVIVNETKIITNDRYEITFDENIDQNDINYDITKKILGSSFTKYPKIPNDPKGSIFNVVYDDIKKFTESKHYHDLCIKLKF